jgi:uncharacterized protein (UPF0179 family)
MGVEADRAEKAALIPTREELSGAIVEMATMAADNEGALAELAEYAAGLETRIAELEAKQ